MICLRLARALVVADLRIKQVRGNEFVELDEEDDEDFVDAVNQTTVCRDNF